MIGMVLTPIEWSGFLDAGSLEHLHQYSKLDVALDPSQMVVAPQHVKPLDGCSCDHLRGSHYVSRMSTAVLAGAQLDDWIADSEDDYLFKAKKAAQQLAFLRQNRISCVNNSSTLLWVIPWV